MTNVKQLLDEKGREVLTIGAEENVLEAIRKMDEMNIGALMVMEGETPVGIFTERHYARRVFLKGKPSPETPLGEVMETHVVVAKLEQTVEECMALMTDKRVRHLPVMEEGKLVGIISIGDLVKAIIADQQFTIEQLTHFIHG